MVVDIVLTLGYEFESQFVEDFGGPNPSVKLPRANVPKSKIVGRIALSGFDQGMNASRWMPGMRKLDHLLETELQERRRRRARLLGIRKLAAKAALLAPPEPRGSADRRRR